MRLGRKEIAVVLLALIFAAYSAFCIVSLSYVFMQVRQTAMGVPVMAVVELGYNAVIFLFLFAVLVYFMVRVARTKESKAS